MIELVDTPGGRRRWPGWDGLLLITLMVGMVGVWLARGQIGGELRLLVGLALSALWLGLTWLSRRPPRAPTPSRHRALVVIPTRNNRETVAQVAAEAIAQHPDVLVVDDGSSDGSGERAAQVAGVRVIRHARNHGKGTAIDSALCWAACNGFSHIVCLDADGQHMASDIPTFVQATRQDPWAIFAGVRDMSTAPGSSQFGRNFSNFWIRVETGHRVADSQCGFRAYPVGPTLSLGLTGGRYEWEVEVLVRAMWNGIAVRDLPCEVYYPSPEDRVTSFRMFRDNVRITLLNTRLVVGRLVWPARWYKPLPPPGGEWRNQHRGRILSWALLLQILRWTGRWPTYALMLPLSAFYLAVAAPQRRGAMAWLRRVEAMGGARASFGGVWRLFYSFACSLVDRFLLLVRGPAAFELVWEGREAVVEALNNGGAIFLSAHIGNPELGAAGLQAGGRGTRVHILQYTAEGDPYVALMRRFARGGPPPTIISLNQGEDLAAMEAIRALRRGEIVAMKGDRPNDTRLAPVSLMQGDVELPTGPYLLAAISGAPVIMLGCFKEGPRRYRVIATPPRVLRFTSRADRPLDLQRWASEFAAQIEDWGRRYPHQWYNFHDPWGV